jgi:hypothetical protein
MGCKGPPLLQNNNRIGNLFGEISPKTHQITLSNLHKALFLMGFGRSFSARWAAASRAIGTRKGEQDT